MRETVFGNTYSAHYDDIYRAKDYEAECDFVETLIQRSGVDVESIIDLGCGTGGHLIPLSRRGYCMTGVDVSPQMLDIAKEKTRSAGIDTPLFEGDLRTVDTGKRYDAAISMFSVFGYLQSNSDVAEACGNIRKMLNPGGLFIFDVWFGPAVIAEPPGQRFRRFVEGDTEILRFTEPITDLENHIVETRFHVLTIRDNRIVARDEENHRVRFFFPIEIRRYLE